jgi:hypothetical protein
MWGRLDLVLWFKETRKTPQPTVCETLSGEVKEMRQIAARWFTLFTAILALSFLANTAFAADDDDPPARAARLSYASGSVSFEPGGTDEWVDAVVNRPMTTGDKLWADQNGRAEVRIDSYALRLGPQTGFSFLNLDDRVVQVRLTEGSLNVRVRRLDENQTLEIDTPNLAFNVLRPGSYRIDVNENGDATLVTVREGQGEVTGGGSAYPVRAGDSVNFNGVDQLSADVEGIGDGDDFDRWSNSRDQRWEHSASARYVSDDAVGYEDLDENGQWDSDPEYGTVWYPRSVAADWAPYRYGHWVWVSPWGWTWVDDASWGFAPFHYGRWVVARGRWCWVPSPPRPAYVTREYVRPVYAPALVAWVGGPHFGVGVAVGGAAAGVAWFPLGPRDVYTPSYHVSEGYVERVNVSNTRIVNRTEVTNVYNNVYVNNTTVNQTNITYQNQRANNAVTATSQASFTTAQPVGRNQVHVDAREVASAPVTPRAAVAPQARSFTGAAAPAKARPPATLASRNVVAKTAPPAPPAPVAQQVKAVEANGGRPVAVTQVRANQPQPAAANVRVAAPAKAAALPPKGNSVNRPGQPGRPAQNQSNAQAEQPNQPNQPANAGNPSRPPNANQPNPNQVNPNQPNANRPNPNASNVENPNRPANANQPNPNQPNANRPNPNASNAENPNRPANANQPNPNQPNANRPNPNASNENPNRANPNRPPNANDPNANRPADNRPATNERPPAARQNAEPQTQQRQQEQQDQLRRQQQQEQQKVEQQRAQQQQQLQQQKADEQRRQDLQRQQQQQDQLHHQQQLEQQKVEQQRAQQQQQLQQQKAEQQKRQDVQRQQQQQNEQVQRKQQQQQEKQQQSPQKEVQKQQPKEQPKEQQKPPKNNQDNKDKDRPPSR